MNRLGWPVIIFVSASAAALVVLADVDGPARSLVVVWFLLVCPGMAYVPLLRIRNPIIEISLAVVLSMVINILLADVMLYGVAWSAVWGFEIMLGICFMGLVLQLLQIQSSLNDHIDSAVDL